MSHTRGQKPESAASPQVRVEPAAEMHTSIRHEKPAVSRRRLLSLATPPGSPKQVLRSFDLRYFSLLTPSILEFATMSTIALESFCKSHQRASPSLCWSRFCTRSQAGVTR